VQPPLSAAGAEPAVGSAAAGPTYRAAGYFVLRAPALPADTVVRILADTTTESVHERLRQVAAEPAVRQALAMASPDLAEALDRADHVDSARSARRRSGVLRYVTRMSTRPTPFGLFAGVAWGTVTDRCAVHLAGPPRRRTRTDLGWLLAVVESAEPALLPSLTLTVNPLVHVVGDRVTLRPADVYGRVDRRSISVRATPVVRAVLDRAGTPCRYGALVDHVSATFPTAPRDRIEGLVRQLHGLHVLTTDLRPRLNQPHPERLLLDALPATPAADALRAGLRRVVTLTDRIDAESPRSSAPLSELAAVQRELAPDHEGTAQQADLGLTVATCELPASVADEVADTVSWLGRVLGPPARASHLLDYHRAFVRRYGLDGVVPLLDLFSPEVGLDSVPTYVNPGRRHPLAAAPSTEGARSSDRLLALYADALRLGHNEIELTDDLLADIGQSAETADTWWSPGLDVTLQVASPSREAMERGDWTAVLAPGSFAPGGRAVGRFADLLGATALDALAAETRVQSERYPDLVHAELSYLPVQGRSANVAMHPVVHPFEIPVNVPPSRRPEDVIPLRDIVVGVAGDRFAVYSARLGKEIRVHQSHMLHPRAAPDPCRFLAETAHDRWAVPVGFDWGALETAPFLPRVRRGRTVLRPAQWSIGPDLPTATEPAFRAALATWRSRWAVPRYVYLADQDRRLLLDLDHPLCGTELWRAVRAATGRIVLQEMNPGFGDLWLTDARGRRYVSELVVSLTLADAATPAQAPAPTRAALASDTRSPRFLPGGEWLSMKLYLPFDGMDDVIALLCAERLAAESARQADRWFYLRYADPEPHLRVRVHAATPDAVGALWFAWTDWARGLADRGLVRDVVVDAYVPETVRYGGPTTLPTIERFFCANSETTARFIHSAPVDVPREVAAGFAVDSIYRHWGFDVEQRLALAARVPRGRADDSPPRAHRRLLADALAEPTLGPLAEAFDSHRTSLVEAAEAARTLAGRDQLTTTPLRIVDSLAHLQVNRLLGTGEAVETSCHRLWAHALRTVLHRASAGSRAPVGR
jgi:thiopeptide-type bacteriocin biosynthesis protein